jgi:hypothetical protein
MNATYVHKSYRTIDRLLMFNATRIYIQSTTAHHDADDARKAAAATQQRVLELTVQVRWRRHVSYVQFLIDMYIQRA